MSRKRKPVVITYGEPQPGGHTVRIIHHKDGGRTICITANEPTRQDGSENVEYALVEDRRRIYGKEKGQRKQGNQRS